MAALNTWSEERGKVPTLGCSVLLQLKNLASHRALWRRPSMEGRGGGCVVAAAGKTCRSRPYKERCDGFWGYGDL